MMNKAVFLDRDGTINTEKDYLYRISDFEYLPGVKEGLYKLQSAGFLLIVVTNQSGIGRGYYKESDYHKLDSWMKADLKKEGIILTDTYYCPHHPEAKVEKYRLKCDCRKPGRGLFEKAIKEYNIDVTQSYAIGDKLRDLTMCEKIAEKSSLSAGFLIYAAEKKTDDTIHYITGGLLEAAEYILMNTYEDNKDGLDDRNSK